METPDRELFINRELSWLAFNERVLAEARESSLPLYERLKFLSISASNLDEFFMVRVAGLKQQLLGGVAELSSDGLSPAEQLAQVGERSRLLTHELYRIWREDLWPRLSAVGMHLVPREKLTAEQRAAGRAYFSSSVFPALTPLAVDPGHPFPHLKNKSLNLAITLRKGARSRRAGGASAAADRETSLAVVQVPSVLHRFLALPSASGQSFLLLEELIALCAGELFPGYAVLQSSAFRVTRNWDLNVDEEESHDLLSTIQDELRRRDRGAAVRLELDAAAPPELEATIASALKLERADVYRISGPLQLSDFSAIAEHDPRPELRVDPFVPAVPAALQTPDSMLAAVAQKDLLLHHPYESFDPVLRFIEEAAEDPSVLAIKQTLYRTSGDSPIARALSRAAENGKEVAVLVEIKARLDEANNIAWARKLEENGVHVVYGLIGLKTHCKLCLVVRREGSGIRRYVHLGTGNYNPTTARLYTDVSLLTAREEIADDATALFNMLTGYARAPQWKRLWVAPVGLHEKVLAMIDRETARARRGEPARIMARMNSLVDPQVIRALYAASAAGVRIELVVRGICCLRPGLPGISENIRVTSVVDRFLEHSRAFAFGVGEHTEVYLSSADWMPRNFFRRVESVFPVEDPDLKQRVLEEVIGPALRDNVKARRLQADGSYQPVSPDGAPYRSQTVLLDGARRALEARATQPVFRHVAAPEIGELVSQAAAPPLSSS